MGLFLKWVELLRQGSTINWLPLLVLQLGADSLRAPWGGAVTTAASKHLHWEELEPNRMF